MTDDNAEQSLILSGERVLLVRRDVAKISGREVGSILILRDNTELHTLLRDLDGVQGLADGLRAQAHGFANKLHVISGLLELGRVEQAVSFISHERTGGALAGVTGQTGIRELEVAALLMMKQARAEELGINITIESESTLPVLAAGSSADILRADLVTIIGNLVDNAVEATASGGKISVEVGCQTALDNTHSLVISVADSGEGIRLDQHERVFAAGYSSKAALPGAVSTGRGIGLTLVKRIATRHGGTVQINNGLPTGVDGHGTRITVTLSVDAAHFVSDQSLEAPAGRG